MSNKTPISSVNDFVVRFANVNGSGSASANELFARSVLRMGVPVSPRNIFPSNIQGLPTWYEVRITEDGHLGARGGVDLMVAMNPQTWDKDVASIEPGGYLFYDNTKPLPASKFRDDITVIGVPLTAICNREYTDPRQRQLFKNIIYVGALSALLDMDVAAIEKLIGEQFKGKEKLLCANKHALHLGRDWATLNLECPIGLRLKRADKVGDRIFIEGNSAAALGAVYGGATRVRLVSDHAVILARGCLHQLLQAAADRSGNQEEQRRHRAGRGRTGLDRHGDRRRLERRARLHRDVGPRHLADAGIPRACLFRGNPGGAVRRAARRPVDRHADAHPAMRHHVLRLCLARRHQARAAVSGGSRRSFRVRRRGLRSRRPAADADLRHARPRHRHEPPPVPAAGLGRRPQIRPRQGDERGRSRRRHGIRPLPRRRRRRHPLSHLSRHASEQGRVLHPRHLARPLRALYRGRRALRRQHAAAAAQVRNRQGPGAAPAAGQRRKADPVRRDLLRLDLAGDGRGDRHARGARQSPRHAARARLPVPPYGRRLHRRPRFRVRGRAEPRRAVALARRQRMRHRPGAARPDPALRRHADHRALHRDRHRRASRRAQSHARCARLCHDLHRQAEIPSPRAAEERRSATPTATTRARFRPCARAAATTRSRLPSSRPASSSRSSRTGWRRFPASAARRRRRTTSLASRTASIRCTAACRRC